MRSWILAALCAVASAQVGTWTTVDSGEVIALDVDFKAYKMSREANELSFEAITGGVLELPVRVTDIEPSSAGTVLVYFDILMPTTTDYAPTVAAFAVRDLFCSPDTIVDIGTPACPSYLEALQTRMPFVAGAYYNDQITDSKWVEQAMPTPLITHSEVVVDMPMRTYAYSQAFYGRAFENAMREVLAADILVTDFQMTANGTTRLLFDVVGPAKNISLLFTSGGCSPCPAGAALSRAAISQGLDAPIAMYI